MRGTSKPSIGSAALKCDKRFPVDQLEAHMKKDHELPRVPCASCGKVVFSQASSTIALLNVDSPFEF